MSIKSKKETGPRGSFAMQQIREALQGEACIAHGCYLWPVDVPRPGQLTQGPCHCLENRSKARYAVTLLRSWLQEMIEREREATK